VVSALSAEQQVALTEIGTHSVLQHLNVVLLQYKTAETLAWVITPEHSADRLHVIVIVIIFAQQAHRFLTAAK
jgi:predicted Zn-dependent protease